MHVKTASVGQPFGLVSLSYRYLGVSEVESQYCGPTAFNRQTPHTDGEEVRQNCIRWHRPLITREEHGCPQKPKND